MYMKLQFITSYYYYYYYHYYYHLTFCCQILALRFASLPSLSLETDLLFIMLEREASGFWV